MAIIPGVTVNWQLSPRVITIPSAFTEITIEDLQDTLLDLEDDVEGILWPTLRETSGGEDLGGGVFVGWTMELQNAVIAPEGRTMSSSTGTVTTADSAGTRLIDASATFITDGVVAGATVFNLTDESVSSIVSVDSETQLTIYPLNDGIDNDFDFADSYKVWNEVQFDITGGNLVAVDDVGTPISPVRSTFGNEILKTSSSSATNANSSQLEHGTFNNHVIVNITSGTAGTTYPIGTSSEPVNNISEAVTIANSRGFSEIVVQGNLTLDTGDVIDGFVLTGGNTNNTTITVNAGASISNTEFKDCLIQGTLDGGSLITNCILGNIDYVDGIISGSMFQTSSTVTLSGAGTAHLLNCYSGTAGTGTPTIDFDGSGSALIMRGYEGGILLTNKTGADNVSIDLASGQVRLDPDAVTGVTSGTIVCRGDGKVVNHDTDAYIDIGTTTFNTATVLNETANSVSVRDGVWNANKEDYTVDGSLADHLRRIKNNKV
jgi:hypothetical protein